MPGTATGAWNGRRLNSRFLKLQTGQETSNSLGKFTMKSVMALASGAGRMCAIIPANAACGSAFLKACTGGLIYATPGT